MILGFNQLKTETNADLILNFLFIVDLILLKLVNNKRQNTFFQHSFILFDSLQIVWEKLLELSGYETQKNTKIKMLHLVCGVTVMIFCARCDGPLVYWPFSYLHLKTFCNLCRVNVICQQGNREQKQKTTKATKIHNQLTLLTMVQVARQRKKIAKHCRCRLEVVDD